MLRRSSLDSSLNPPFLLEAPGSVCLSSCFPVTRLCFIRQKKVLRAPVVNRDGLTGVSAGTWTPAAHTNNTNCHFNADFYLSFDAKSGLLLLHEPGLKYTYLQHQWGVGECSILMMLAAPSPCWCLWGGWSQTSSGQSAPTVNPNSMHYIFLLLLIETNIVWVFFLLVEPLNRLHLWLTGPYSTHAAPQTRGVKVLIVCLKTI